MVDKKKVAEKPMEPKETTSPETAPAQPEKAEGNGESLMTAESFKKLYVAGEEIVVPSGTKYKIRPISSLFYLSGGGTQLHAVQLVINEAIAARQRVSARKKATPKEAEEGELEVGKLELKALRKMEQFKTTMAPVLCQGLVQPKVVDQNVAMRALAKDEVSVHDFMHQFEEAFHIYVAIVNLSTGKGESPTGDVSFPEGGEKKGA